MMGRPGPSMLADYVAQGGKLLVMAGPVEDGQPTALVARSAVVDLVEAVNAVVLN